MLNNASDLLTYGAIVVAGLLGAVCLQLLPGYMFASSLVYGQF